MTGEPQRIRPSNGWNMMAMNKNYTAWQKGEFCALSSVCFIHDEHLPPHWEWLISFSNMGRTRLSDKEMEKCLADFNASDFEEDNHERGIARKYWQAIEPQYRKLCPCKDEVVIAEGEYQYSVKKGTGHE